MVAISVILSAVVGAFVLEIGDQQEMAPQTSFGGNERTVLLDSDYVSDFGGMNTTQATIDHVGGETLPVSQTEIVVNGHADAWGVVPHHNALSKAEGAIPRSVDFGPQPDWRGTIGSNERVEFGSGETWNVVAYDVQKQVDLDGDGFAEQTQKVLYEPGTHDVKPRAGKAGHDYVLYWTFDTAKHGKAGREYQCSCTVLYFTVDDGSGAKWSPAYYGWGPQLEDEDQVDVVWSAQSGGKIQTLYSYSVNLEDTDDTYDHP
jgi:hypothetical protein